MIKKNLVQMYFSCCKDLKINILYLTPADMAELVDALVSGTSGSNTLEVRVFLSAPYFAQRALYGKPVLGL